VDSLLGRGFPTPPQRAITPKSSSILGSRYRRVCNQRYQEYRGVRIRPHSEVNPHSRCGKRAGPEAKRHRRSSSSPTGCDVPILPVVAPRATRPRPRLAIGARSAHERSVIDGPSASNAFRGGRRRRGGPYDSARARTRRPPRDHTGGESPMRRPHLSATHPRIWLPSGGRGRVSPWRSTRDTRLDARGAAFALATPRNVMEYPHWCVTPRRVSGAS